MTSFRRFGRETIPIKRPILKDRFQRPQNYTISVGTIAVCVAPNRQRSPVKSFLVQSDLDNFGRINVGNSHVSITVGIQLDPGSAWLFSVSNEDLISGALPTVSGFAKGEREQDNKELFLDMSDFFVVSDVAGQTVRVVWSTIAL